MDIDEYKTKNLNIAAFLYASGVQLVTTTRVHNEVFFIFSPKDTAEHLINDYFSDIATVNPRELFARLNDLKDLIFSGGRNG